MLVAGFLRAVRKITSYMKAECERDFERDAKWTASIQSQRAKLWSLVPEADRPSR